MIVEKNLTVVRFADWDGDQDTDVLILTMPVKWSTAATLLV